MQSLLGTLTRRCTAQRCARLGGAAQAFAINRHDKRTLIGTAAAQIANCDRVRTRIGATQAPTRDVQPRRARGTCSRSPAAVRSTAGRATPSHVRQCMPSVRHVVRATCTHRRQRSRPLAFSGEPFASSQTCELLGVVASDVSSTRAITDMRCRLTARVIAQHTQQHMQRTARRNDTCAVRTRHARQQHRRSPRPVSSVPALL